LAKSIEQLWGREREAGKRGEGRKGSKGTVERGGINENQYKCLFVEIRE